MTDPVPLIRADSLNCGYGKQPVLHDVSFSLTAGLVHGLIGANGTGKTTLMRTLAGQLQFSGELVVCGARPFDNPAVMDRTTLAGVDVPLPDGWSARRLFAIGAARHRRWDAAQADDLLSRFGVPVSTSYRRLSRGQKSALSIIYACASGAELLLLDEPYLGLDVQKRALFYDVLAEQMDRPDTTAVLSTHHLHEVETLLDTVLYLDGDGVAMNGPIDDLADAVIEVAGPTEDVDRMLGRLGTPPELVREDLSVGSRVMLDLRNSPAAAESVYEAAGQVSDRIRVGEVTLEQAVLALGGERA
ncbi:MAG TPA: ABC transporter ATP-binding protein [Corynebacterium sp.]|nr:ABC transporter ATP-binding protein [Corynebacterium sp.]